MTTADPVKLLSDDEVDRIQQLPVTMNGNIKPQPGVVLTAQDRNALCATVRALRAELERIPLAQSALRQLDELRAANQRATETNTALREQLAEARELLGKEIDAGIELQRQLAQVTQERDDFRLKVVNLCRAKADDYDDESEPQTAHVLRALAGALERQQ